jgi:hypothetical protein
MSCTLVAADNDLIVSICSDWVNTYAYITYCGPEHVCQPLEYVLLPNVGDVRKTELRGINLVVLHSGIV